MIISHTIFWILSIGLFVPGLFCMEQQIISHKDQTCIMLPVLDGKFSIEKRKLFGSATLRDHYLKNRELVESSGELPLFPYVTREELWLYTHALDHLHSASLKDHINSLSYKERNVLISLVQAYGKQNKKLEDFGLTLGLIDACFPEEICHHIKSYLGSDDLAEYMIQGKIDNEALFLPQQKYNDLYPCVSEVSDLLLTDKSNTTDYFYMSHLGQYISKFIAGDMWNVCCFVGKKDKQLFYYITPTEVSSKEVVDAFYLWTVDSVGKVVNKICIKHSGEITAFCFCPIQSVIASCAYSSNKSTIKLWNFKGELIGELPEFENNCVMQVVFDSTGTRLFVNSLGSVVSTVTQWYWSEMEKERTYNRPGNDFFCYVLPQASYQEFVATTHRGSLVFNDFTNGGWEVYEYVPLVNEGEVGTCIKHLYHCYYRHRRNGYDYNHSLVVVMPKKELQGVEMWNGNKKFMDFLLCKESSNSGQSLLDVDHLNKNIYHRRMALHKTDERIGWLINKSTLLQFVGLRSLCEKYRGNKKVQLYQDGLAALIIKLLPADKQCNVVGLVNTCFSIDYGNSILNWFEGAAQENCVVS